MRNILRMSAPVLLAASLFWPTPAHASHFQSYSATVGASDGTTCTVYASLSHSGGGVTGLTEIDCNGAVYRLVTNATFGERAALVYTPRSAQLHCLDFNTFYCGDSSAASPGLTGLSYSLESMEFRIELYLPAYFTSYPSGCIQDTVASSGRYRLICSPPDLQFML